MNLIVKCYRVSLQVHNVLADTSSVKMENVFNKEIPHDSELQKPEDLSVCLPESARSLSQVNVEVSVFIFI